MKQKTHNKNKIFTILRLVRIIITDLTFNHIFLSPHNIKEALEVSELNKISLSVFLCPFLMVLAIFHNFVLFLG